MKTSGTAVCTIPVIVLSLLAAARSTVRADENQSPTKTPETTAPSPETPGSGFFVVPDETWMMLAEDADGHFQKAAEAIVSSLMKQAGKEVRKGAAFLKIEANRAGRDDRPFIEKAVLDLNGLAAKLESGDGSGPGAFTTRFAEAHYVTARHLWRRAGKEWANHDAVAAGRDLQAAVIHLEQGFNWAEIRLPKEKVDAIHGAGELGARMMEDTVWTPADVDSSLVTIGAEIQSLGSGLGQ